MFVLVLGDEVIFNLLLCRWNIVCGFYNDDEIVNVIMNFCLF